MSISYTPYDFVVYSAVKCYSLLRRGKKCCPLHDMRDRIQLIDP
jgi:hypothetical protein